MKNKPVTKSTIEKRYARKILKVLNQYEDRTMEELWIKLDEIKEKMRKELNAIGIE